MMNHWTPPRHQSYRRYTQGSIKDSADPGAVPNVGPLQTYNQLTELLKIFHSHQLRAHKNLWVRVLQQPS